MALVIASLRDMLSRNQLNQQMFLPSTFSFSLFISNLILTFAVLQSLFMVAIAMILQEQRVQIGQVICLFFHLLIFIIMKGKKDNKNEETKKYLYAEPKFMIPPDPLKLPEPFSKVAKKEEQVKKN